MSADLLTVPPTPLLSVVMPVHNGVRWLGETLTAVFQQTFLDFELILVDDASTDDLPAVLRSFQDPRLRLVRLSQNLGVSAARNQGVAKARGEFLALCDADDLCLPGRFAQQLEFLQRHPEIGVCGSAFVCFDSQERETVTHPTQPEQIRQALMQGNCFGTSTMMGRTRVFQRFPFTPGLEVAEDFDLWTRMAAAGVRMANLPDSLVRYRLHTQQSSRTKGERLDHAARKICCRYCAELLAEPVLLRAIEQERTTLDDLATARRAIVAYSAQHPKVDAQEFRFLLAWLYQQLPSHGIGTWWHWRALQGTLNLQLDRNYRFNIFLLALLPMSLTRKYFATLIKLKR